MSFDLEKSFQDFRVYVGFDSSNFGQEMAYAVCRRSIERWMSKPVEVRRLVKSQLEASGDFWREDQTGVTEFTYTRFLTPYLNGYRGWALFVDSDFLFNVDVWTIFNEVRTWVKENMRNCDVLSIAELPAVFCVQHDIKKTDSVKMNGLPQENYPRKNWSSCMLFNCAHPVFDKMSRLSPEVVSTETPAYLHRMKWCDDLDSVFKNDPDYVTDGWALGRIGKLNHDWNYLVGYYSDKSYSDLPRVIHYTNGGPWHPGYETCEFGDLWMAYLSLDEATRVFEEREELRREMCAK